MPLAIFTYAHWNIIKCHAEIIFRWWRTVLFTCEKCNDLCKVFTWCVQVALLVLPFSLSILAYAALLVIFVSCKLMWVPSCAFKFLELAGRADHFPADFERMAKVNLWTELLFESFGLLVIAIIDVVLRSLQPFRSSQGISFWALLLIICSVFRIMRMLYAKLYAYYRPHPSARGEIHTFIDTVMELYCGTVPYIHRREGVNGDVEEKYPIDNAFELHTAQHT